MFGHYFKPRRAPRTYSLAPLFLLYTKCLAAMAGISVVLYTLDIGISLTLALLLLFAHCVCGTLLSRSIDQRLAWNNQFANLSLAAREKLRIVLFWPLATPLLLIQMAIMKYL